MPSLHLFLNLAAKEAGGLDQQHDDQDRKRDGILPCGKADGGNKALAQADGNAADHGTRNGTDAAQHGGSGKRIAVHLSQQEGEYVITIRDFGPGIPEAELPYVKQKFYKGSSKARGSGIGLALVDSIMTALDGTMDIKSTLGRGTVVTLGLPLYKK